MPDIKDIKEVEMIEILDFYDHIVDYGHIFALDPKLLDEPFKKIMDGINEVQQMMDDSYEM
jgi:endonuclease IV|tara:strand:- start:1249 stop:1431 length:183 start_codon:yes stop_codon:yes gene_type:complete